MLATALILAQIPPPLTVVNGINADDLYNITTGDPGTCQCESPKCGAPGAGTRIMHGESKKFGPAGGCYYFALGGGIKASGDGMICRTWRADSKGCNIYPGSTDGNCSRILTTPCSVAGGVDAQRDDRSRVHHAAVQDLHRQRHLLRRQHLPARRAGLAREAVPPEDGRGVR